MKLSDLRTSEEVLADQLRDPAFRAEWERTAVARAFALRVLAYRTENGLSQRALADALSMSQPQVARLEAATHNPTIETMSRVADVLGTDIDVKVPPQHGEPSLTMTAVRPVRQSGTRETVGDRVGARRAAAG